MTATCTLGYPSPPGNSFTRSVLGSIIAGPCEPVTLDIQLSCFIRRYRTFDGSCNNLCNVTTGSAQTPFSRLLSPAYQDGKHAPRSQGSTNQPLPNARNVSKIVFVSSKSNGDNATANFTHVTMVWGQFLDHDITLTQLNESVECGNNSLPCRGPEEGCIGIDILQGNELKDNRSAVCIPLRRSAIKNGEQASFYDKMLPRAWGRKKPSPRQWSFRHVWSYSIYSKCVTYEPDKMASELTKSCLHNKRFRTKSFFPELKIL